MTSGSARRLAADDSALGEGREGRLYPAWPFDPDRSLPSSTARRDRDPCFDTLTDLLAEYIKSPSTYSPGVDVPMWLKAELVSVVAMRSHKKMTRLLAHWRVNRFAGDEKIFERLTDLTPDAGPLRMRVRGLMNTPSASGLQASCAA